MRGTCQHLLRFAPIAISLIITACGGGSSGNGGSAGQLSLATNTLTFTAPSTNSTPPSQIVTATVTGVASGTLYIKIVSTGPAVASISDVAITTSTTGQASVYPASATTLGPGVYDSTITVYACTSDPACSSGQLAGSPQTINVTYTISGFGASPSSLNYSIGNSPIDGDLKRLLTVTAYPDRDWSIASDVAWLSVSPTTGNTGDASQVTASLEPAQLDTLNNGTYSGSVTITPTSGPAVTVPVTQTISRTQVNYVAPYIAVSGVSEEVIIRGDNFSEIAVQNVKFGDYSASTFNIISATEIRATHPALAAGNYPVQLENNSGAYRSLAKLVVVDPPTFDDVTISRSGTITGFLYDAEREAIYVANRTNNEIERYKYNSVDWISDSIAVNKLRGIALTPDGGTILAMSDDSVVHISTETFTVTTTSNAPYASDAILASRVDLNNVAVANDGIASIMTETPASSGYDSAYSYNISTREFTSISYTLTSSNQNVTATGDGSRVVAVGTLGSPPGRVFYYDSSSGKYIGTSIFQNAYYANANRDGSRWILNLASMYDDQFTLYSTVPKVGGPAFSPDGRYLYVYTDSDGTIHKYDLDVLNGDGVISEIGTGTAVPTAPLSPYVVTPYMTITPDGSKLIIAGDDKLRIQTAP